MSRPLMLCSWIPVEQELPLFTQRDDTPIVGRPNAPATLRSADVLVVANGKHRIDHLVGAEGSERRDWYTSTGVTLWMPLPEVPIGEKLRATPAASLTEDQVEFALNNQLEDPSDDEARGFHAGARWAAALNPPK